MEQQLNYYEIGQRIRQLRKQNQLSQEELAEKVGISTTHMSHIETGNTKLSLPALAALVVSLHTGADDLLFGRHQPAQALQDLFYLLEDCPPQQLQVLRDIVKAAKCSMDANL